ncbi:MAG TPA: hypothetical protein VF481_17755 [Novosphingobium sp.]
MWHQLARCLAIVLGCLVASEPAQAAVPAIDNVDSDAELFPSADSSALITSEGPQFARSEAAVGGAGDDVMFAKAEVVDMDELGEQRGGFVLDGLDIKLGAQVQTLVNGELALTTAITWSDSGVQTSQIVSNMLSQPTAQQLQSGLLKTGNISLNVGGSTVYLANDGQTALIQNATSGIQNVIVNTASNTSIQTMVNATVDLSGYAAFQATNQSNALGSSLGSAIGNATIGVVH